MTGTPDFVHRWVPGERDLVVLALHGTGGDENDLIPLVRAVAPSAAVLSPRGKVSEGGAPRFFRRLAEGRFDVEDLIARTHELADFVGAAAEGYSFDPARVVALGYSNGANIAGSMLLLRPDVLAGAALLRPMAPFRPGESPRDDLPDLSATRVLVSAGQHDPLIPSASTDALVAHLKGAGVDLVDRRQRAGHELVQGDVEALSGWFATW